jgi:flavin-dependent dehydrogenase
VFDSEQDQRMQAGQSGRQDAGAQTQMPRADARRCDVLVVGAGPAGATIAALLAERGLEVVIVEKDRHPRFHIGESLLPMNLPLFERLGVQEEIARIGMVKRAAELNSPQHDAPVNLAFGQAWDKRFPYAYQVRRSEFDQILFEHCVRRGATALQDCRVTEVQFTPEAALATARHRDGEVSRFEARFLVDASGRDTLLAGKLGLKRRNPRHASAALFGHFRNAERLAGEAEGNISLFWFEHGWFWFIPLRDGTTSVGAVCWPHYLKTRKSDPTQFLLDTIALCPPLARRLERAEPTGPATATGNYSYLSRRMAGERHILIGDAFAFVDPVFSSGVFLAMNSAFLGAEVVEAALRNPAAAPRLQRRFEHRVRFGLRQFSWFIYRMTSPAMRELFMAPRNYLRMQEALLSLLAGDLFRGTPIRSSLLAFKALYYLTTLLHAKDNLRAWRRRRRMMRSALTERPEASSPG